MLSTPFGCCEKMSAGRNSHEFEASSCDGHLSLLYTSRNLSAAHLLNHWSTGFNGVASEIRTHIFVTCHRKIQFSLS
jgi:hypothetical protein